MTNEALKRGIEIAHNLESLKTLLSIIHVPHPKIYDDRESICLISVGKEAEIDIKRSIVEAIYRNMDKLKKELEEL